MSNYVYVKTEPDLWTVGFYAPDGKWHTDSDHDNKPDARTCVIMLNGGIDPAELATLRERVAKFEGRIPVCRLCATSHDPGTDCPTHEVMAMVYATMQAENKELRKDQGRLDSMISCNWYVKSYKEFDVVYDESGEVAQGDTPRAAIDAAMEESNGQK